MADEDVRGDGSSVASSGSKDASGSGSEHVNVSEHGEFVLPARLSSLGLPKTRKVNSRTPQWQLDRIQIMYEEATRNSGHLSPPALKAFVRQVADEMVLSRTRVKAAVDRVAARGTTEYEVAGSHNKKRRVLNDEQALYLKRHLEERQAKKQRVDYKYVKAFLPQIPGVDPTWTPSQGIVAKTLKRIDFVTRRTHKTKRPSRAKAVLAANARSAAAAASGTTTATNAVAGRNLSGLASQVLPEQAVAAAAAAAAAGAPPQPDGINTLAHISISVNASNETRA